MSKQEPEQVRVLRLRSNYEAFDSYVVQAQNLLDAGRPDEAAMFASVATWFAAKKHPGLFASHRLETILNTIGRSIPDPQPGNGTQKNSGSVQKILHVTTELPPVGGLTSLVSRWIQTDTERQHSLVLTRQRKDLPDYLVKAVSQRGGKIYNLNKTPGHIRDWAKRLRAIAADYDLMVLNIHNEDIVPIIAFSGTTATPPVALLNHADHLFWLGASMCHSVLSLREAAAEIVVQRRGIPPERSLLLPTLVKKPERTRTREEARAKIGAPDDSIVMISVARGAKYRPIDNKTYADRFIDVLKENPKARLYVVGSGMPEGWEAASRETGGRIFGLAETPAPSAYFEAADIYVDSYPFSSSTSLMEAAGFGLPLVTLFLAPEEARLVGINHLGLIGGINQARSEADWAGEITRLIQDESYRRERSAAAAEAVRIAQPTEWMNWLERAYADTLALPPVPPTGLELTPGPDILQTGEPDIRHEDMYGSEADVDDYIRDFTSMLPFPARLRTVSFLNKAGAVRSPIEAVKMMIPEWIKSRMRA